LRTSSTRPESTLGFSLLVLLLSSNLGQTREVTPRAVSSPTRQADGLCSLPSLDAAKRRLSVFRHLASAYHSFQGGPSGARSPTAKPPEALTLDINHATAEDFQKLPGIGPRLAQRIVAYRRKHGPFRRVEDLMAVKGLGLKKWKAIRPHLRVESPARKK
jgi:competence ComEA-like helix-hairpin-helix protein